MTRRALVIEEPGTIGIRERPGLVHRLEPGTSLVDAAVIEPSSVVLRALEKAGLDADERVLVVGDGTIGLLAAYLASLWSPASVTMVGRRPEQARLAASVGVTR